MFETIDQRERAFAQNQYLANRGLAAAIFVAQVKKPLFVEGEAGVGKTELAKVLAHLLNTRLIRL